LCRSALPAAPYHAAGPRPGLGSRARRALRLAAWLLAGIAAAAPAAAEAAPDTAEPATQETHPAASWLADFGRRKEALEASWGTRFSLYIDATSQTALNGPGEGRSRTVFFWQFSLRQQLRGGAAPTAIEVHARGGSGRGLDGLVGGNCAAPRCGTNWTAGEGRCVYVSHLFVEQKLLDERLTLWLGKIDWGDYFDTNAAGSWNFLSYSLARNPLIPAPWHAIGAVVRYDALDWLYVQAGVFDAEAVGTETGLATAFGGEDYTVGLFEFGLRPSFAGLGGNYRFYMWYDPQPLARNDGGGNVRDDVGFGLSFDQQLTASVTAFCRYGFAHHEARQVEHFWSVGAVWKGPVASRPADELGVGVGQSRLSPSYRRAEGLGPRETLFEAYYRIQLTSWVSLSPDVQVILDSGGSTSNDVAVIAGLRLIMEF
jgi:porin